MSDDDFPLSSPGPCDRAKQRARELLAAGRNAVGSVELPSTARFILMYHRVLPGNARLPYPIQPGMYVTEETFAKHLEQLQSMCDIVPLSRIVDSGPGRERPVCAITFDDGWRDTFETAFPLLRERDVPATVFLPTGFIGTDRWFWPERVAYLEAKRSRERGDHLVERADRRIEDMKTLAPEEREKEIRKMEESLGDEVAALPEGPPLMTWDQVRELAGSGIEIGSHTVHHTILTGVSAEEASRELAESKRTIEEELGRPSDLFCYPNGDFDSEVRTLVEKAGYRLAVTTRPGWATADSDPLALPRIGVHEDVSRTRPLFTDRIRRAAGRTPVAAESRKPEGE